MVIKLTNSEPVELKDLARSLNAIAEQYAVFAHRSPEPIGPRTGKLCVKKIEQGSIVAELFDFAASNAMNFMEASGTILGFYGYLKAGMDYMLGKGAEPEGMTSVDYKDFSQIVSPVAKDNAAQYNFSTTINGDVHLTFSINHGDAEMVQAMAKAKRKDLLEPAEVDNIRTEVLLYWFQARDGEGEAGNKAIIEDISKEPLNVTWSSPDLKTEMSKGHPFQTIYVVDVKLQTVQDKVAAYRILNLHRSFPKEGGIPVATS